MPDLQEGQWELGGLLLGKGQPVQVSEFDLPGPDLVVGDLDPEGADGRVMGYDYVGGRDLAFAFFVDQDDGPSARTAWRNLTTVWTNPGLRTTPGAVTELRIRDYGWDTRVVYGRGRQLDPVSTALLQVGRVDLTGVFATVDHRYYADAEQDITLDLLPQIGAGLILPVTLPAILAPLGASDTTTLSNDGDADSWPVVEISGPITNPGLEWVASGRRFQLTTTLAWHETVTVDMRPWAQTAIRSDGASMAEHLDGPAMADLGIPPGPTQVRFTGQDPTGTSRARVRFRSAYTAP